MGRLSGVGLENTVLNFGGAVQVIFVSDNTNQQYGFNLSVSFLNINMHTRKCHAACRFFSSRDRMPHVIVYTNCTGGTKTNTPSDLLLKDMLVVHCMSCIVFTIPVAFQWAMMQVVFKALGKPAKLLTVTQLVS